MCIINLRIMYALNAIRVEGEMSTSTTDLTMKQIRGYMRIFDENELSTCGMCGDKFYTFVRFKNNTCGECDKLNSSITLGGDV
jgi:protein-arginine kinase activator protein McsA